MPTGIDHVVIAVADPDASAAELTERVGLAFTGGGRHPGLGTFNRLAFLGDAYLELIGVEDAEAAQGWAVGRAAVRSLERGGGFVTCALVDDRIAMTGAQLQVNGSSIGPAIHGSRQGSDGETVEWWTATLPELGPEQPPFLIKHAAAGAEWGPAAREERRSFVHPLGSPTRLRGLEIPAPDPIALAAECSRQLGLEFWVTGTSAVSTPGKHVVRLVSAPPARLPLITLGARRGMERRVSAHGVEFSVLGVVA